MCQITCQQQTVSCSACCGIFNINGGYIAVDNFLKENTSRFLEIDLTSAQNIADYRKQREKEIEPLKLDNKTYSCVFVGYIDQHHKKTGCLMHPSAGIRPEVSNWQHPQNFSFYGEGICQSYDCFNKDKQRTLPSEYFKPGSLIYAQFAGNHNLLNLVGVLVERQYIKEKILEFFLEIIEHTPLPVTSFQQPIDFDNLNEHQLLSYLFCLSDATNYEAESLIYKDQPHDHINSLRRKLT